MIGLFKIQSKDTGIEIYMLKKSYPDFTQENKPECYYCLDIKREDLFEKPLLSEKDFKKFDWVNQQIELTEDAKQKIKELKIPLQGLPVAMVLNGEIIYEFWFWNEFSSFGCDRVYTYPRLEFKLNCGIPESYFFGNDPRFDERLKNYVSNIKEK
jgi:hypothetical protein